MVTINRFTNFNLLERLAYLKMNPDYPLDENVKLKKDYDFNKLLKLEPTEKDLYFASKLGKLYDTVTSSDARWIDSVEHLAQRLKAVVKIKGNHYEFVKWYDKRFLDLGFTSYQISQIRDS